MTNSKPNLTVHTQEDDDDSLSSLLDIAAENNLQKFTASINHNPAAVDEIGLWYGRKKGSKRMVLEERTPLMVASTYGSLDVMELILSLSSCDVNRRCGPDRTTALHCASSGGSENAADAVKILLSNGADVAAVDSNGLRPADVIAVSPSMLDLKFVLEDLLGGGSSASTTSSTSTSTSTSTSPPLSSSSYSDSTHSNNILEEKREFPIDPSHPDIKNSIYATDEFRMFSFKVRPCSRAYSHDWTECPFVHPGENARRRDPRKYHYSCVPCPEFRKGACRRGDLCEYAHGVFECWLHPAQYRTRLCKDGTSCGRRVCFFAHTAEELRPLYVSTGSAVPSLRSMDISFLPGSPSSFMAPPLSPSAAAQSVNAWPQQSVPSLHLPLNRKLRSSLSARDELAMLARSMQVRSKTLNPSNLDELFVAEMNSSSPRYSSTNSPSHKSNLLNHQTIVPTSIESFPRNPLFNPSFGIPSPRMSPRSFESSRVSAQMRSLSSRDLGLNAATVGSPLSSSWFNWGSPSGKLDWGVNGEELGRLRQSMISESGLNGEELDVSWVQSLVNTQEAKERVSVIAESSNGGGGGGGGGGGDDSNSNGQIEEHAVLGAWLEQMQLDQLVA